MTTTESQIDKLIAATDIIDRIANGPYEEVVTTEQGDSITVTKAITDMTAFNPRGDWATLEDYEIKDLVNYSDIVYVVVVDHTSGVFATDLADGKIAVYQNLGNTWGDWQTPIGLSCRRHLYSTGNYGELRYRKSADGKLLQFRGALEIDPSPTDLIFTLPVGYRPTYIANTHVSNPDNVTKAEQLQLCTILVDGLVEVDVIVGGYIFNFNFTVALD